MRELIKDMLIALFWTFIIVIIAALIAYLDVYVYPRK